MDIMIMSNTEKMNLDQLEEATGGARVNATFAEATFPGKTDPPKCPICGTTMQASGITINGEPVASSKWICPKCGYAQTVKK